MPWGVGEGVQSRQRELSASAAIAARRDELHEAGNLLGGEQSGFIAEIGFEMYQKILDEAIRELKRKEFKDLFAAEIQQQDDFVRDCSIHTDLEILIRDDYVESITERLSLYKRLDNCENEKELNQHFESVKNRAKAYFGNDAVFIEKFITNARHIEVHLRYIGNSQDVI
jgi:transcription-repair coupling factor (superfamily II helicase)